MSGAGEAPDDQMERLLDQLIAEQASPGLAIRGTGLESPAVDLRTIPPAVAAQVHMIRDELGI